MDQLHLNPPRFSSYVDQLQSPIFSILPGEVRHLIWSYALTDYEDTQHLYDKNTYYRRPGYDAPRRTAVELLRTCKRVFGETWFMPFAHAEHALYLTSSDRAPKRMITTASMQKCLKMLHDSQGDVTIDRVRVFAQLWALEPGNRFEEILNMEYFYPKSMTVTLRYTDFWFWERNQSLWVAARWVNISRFPDSLTEFSIDFESIERRKDEINYIAHQAAEHWHFQRKDGTILAANKTDMSISISTVKWTGSSTWGGQRWVRDETRPNQIDYHVVTITWRPISSSSDKKSADVPSECPDLRVPVDFPRPPAPQYRWASLPVDGLEQANVPPDATAEEACRAFELYRFGTRRSRRGRPLEGTL